MKWYNTETRNEVNDFYRRGDWSVEKPTDWKPPHNNFTNVAPPSECLADDPVACDWDGEKWILDVASVSAQSAKHKMQKYREVAILKQAKAEAERVNDTDTAARFDTEISKLEA